MGSISRRCARYSPKWVEEPNNLSSFRIGCKDSKMTSQLNTLKGFPRAESHDIEKRNEQPGRCIDQYRGKNKGHDDLDDHSW